MCFCVAVCCVYAYQRLHTVNSIFSYRPVSVFRSQSYIIVQPQHKYLQLKRIEFKIQPPTNKNCLAIVIAQRPIFYLTRWNLFFQTINISSNHLSKHLFDISEAFHGITTKKRFFLIFQWKEFFLLKSNFIYEKKPKMRIFFSQTENFPKTNFNKLHC